MLLIAGPVLGLWLASPFVAWWLSRTIPAEPVRLSDSQRLFLRKLTRRTWRYFEVFVTAEENWLPPDNYQESSADGIASRTSPTNIGVALLADLAACDFGYCSVGRLLDRLSKSFTTLARLERHRGHFYNWYHTRTLKPLLPLYVSTVDSGNLVGHLLVLRSGLLELVDTKVLPSGVFDGVRDTACMLLDAARGLHHAKPEARVPLVPLDVLRKLERLLIELENRSDTLSGAAAFLQRLVTVATEIAAEVRTDEELRWWAAAFERSCTEQRDNLLFVAAWGSLPPLPESLLRLDRSRELLALLNAVPSLREVAGLQQIRCCR